MQDRLINKKFGYLTVIKEVSKSNGRRRLKCKCRCGKIKIFRKDCIVSGATKSCGCYKSTGNHMRKYHPRITSARHIWKKNYHDGNLTFEQFYQLSQQNCYYCNNKPCNISNRANQHKQASRYAQKHGKFVYNGLDRVDNSLPHNYENCVPCCKYCNFAKRERTVKEFFKWIKQIYKHNHDRKKKS